MLADLLFVAFLVVALGFVRWMTVIVHPRVLDTPAADHEVRFRKAS